MPSRITNQYNNYKLGKLWDVPKIIIEEWNSRIEQKTSKTDDILLRVLSLDPSNNSMDVLYKKRK